MKRLSMPGQWSAASISVLLAIGCSSREAEYREPPPPTVAVATPVVRDVTLFAEETGRLEAAERAEVRARVRGFVEQILFSPGAAVEKGDELYRIERTEYEAARSAAAASVKAAEAAVSVAKAEVESAAAAVEQAKQDFSRQERLLESQGTSQAEYDAALAARDRAIAGVASAKAAVLAAEAESDVAKATLAQAEIDLDYTVVKAPISGRITKTEVKLGNLVDSGALLATIVDDSRVYANFNASDREVLRYLESQSAQSRNSRERPQWESFVVSLRRETDPAFDFEGHLDYVDQAGVDPATGTIALRAVFENPDAALIPGLFVYLRIPLSEIEDAVLVPEYAVQRDPRGTYVLTVDAESVVERREIVSGRKRDGWAIIESGLTPSDRFIVEGLQKARPGSPVDPQRETLQAGGPGVEPDEAASDPPPETDVTTSSDSE